MTRAAPNQTRPTDQAVAQATARPTVRPADRIAEQATDRAASQAPVDGTTSTPLAGSPWWPTVRGIWLREVLLFRNHWLPYTFGALIEPLIYMVGFGLGFGRLISSVDGRPYLQFIGTGMVVTATLFASAFAGMFETHTRRRYLKIYDAILAEPVGVPELVIAENSWIAVKATAYGCLPLVVTFAIGLSPGPEAALVPLICLLSGVGFGLFGVWVSALVPTVDGLRLTVSGLLTPLVMAAGVFYPVDSMPGWLRVPDEFNPIYHCAQLVRHASFGELGLDDLGHAGALVVFVALMVVLSIRAMRRKLIT